MRSFAGLLAQHLVERGLTATAFADQVGYSQSYLSKVLRCMRPPPLGMLSHWSDALALSAVERERFYLAAGLSLVPEMLHPALVDLARRAHGRLGEVENGSTDLLGDLLMENDDPLALAHVRGKGRRRR